MSRPVVPRASAGPEVEGILLLCLLVVMLVVLMIVPIAAFRFGEWLTQRFRRD